MTTHADQRTVFVPDGLAGERVDAAMARMFGFSRTKAADLITHGLVQVDGAVAGKSDRVHAGSMLDVTIPAETDPLAVVPETVEGIRINHDDDAIVVIDKPVGVAVHPSPGWSGPTVVGHLAGAGFRISTSGASERQGPGRRSRALPRWRAPGRYAARATGNVSGSRGLLPRTILARCRAGAVASNVEPCGCSRASCWPWPSRLPRAETGWRRARWRPWWMTSPASARM